MEDFLKYIPLDKSWLIRMGVLDLTHGYQDIGKFLANQENLGDDLIALKRVAEKWDTEEPLNVGESGTLYRFVQFYFWKNKIDREIIKEGSLLERGACNNPGIINWTLEKLLDLDGGTTQWASASIINGSTEKITVPRYKNKLQLSYDAVEHWNSQRNDNLCWEPKYDRTIEKQAIAFINYLKTGKIYFSINHSEDYCFGRAFELINKEIGENIFPQIRRHESDRLQEMEEALEDAVNYRQVFSEDHRVIQAVVMKSLGSKNKINVLNPQSVNKSWPQFWNFIEYCKNFKSGQ